MLSHACTVFGVEDVTVMKSASSPSRFVIRIAEDALKFVPIAQTVKTYYSFSVEHAFIPVVMLVLRRSINTNWLAHGVHAIYQRSRILCRFYLEISPIPVMFGRSLSYATHWI